MTVLRKNAQCHYSFMLLEDEHSVFESPMMKSFTCNWCNMFFHHVERTCVEATVSSVWPMDDLSGKKKTYSNFPFESDCFLNKHRHGAFFLMLCHTGGEVAVLLHPAESDKYFTPDWQQSIKPQPSITQPETDGRAHFPLDEIGTSLQACLICFW